MRSEDEIRIKFEQLYKRRLVERKEKFLGRNFRNCSYNVRMRVKGHGKCGFCRNSEALRKMGAEDRPFVCDEEGTALRCPFFSCRNTTETVEEDFASVLSSPARCGVEYPKLAVLIWCLQAEGMSKRSQRFWQVVRAFCAALIELITLRWW
jgi:hypothetical protein